MSNTIQFSWSRFLGDYQREEDFNSCKRSIKFTIYRHLTISVKGSVFPVYTQVWKVAVVVSKAPKGLGDANEKAQKSIGLFSKTITFLHDYEVKFPPANFYGGRKQTATTFFFFFHPLGNSPAFDDSELK